MPRFLSHPKKNPVTGGPVMTVVDGKDAPEAERFTDPTQHKEMVPEEMFDRLYLEFVKNRRKDSGPVQDPYSEKWYHMTEGNSPTNDPERGLYAGPIIEELTQDKAKSFQKDKAPVLQELMEHVRELQAKVDRLQAEKDSPGAGIPPATEAPVSAPKKSYTVAQLGTMHWATAKKAIETGEADEALVQITLGEDFSEALKKAATGRLQEIQEKQPPEEPAKEE